MDKLDESIYNLNQQISSLQGNLYKLKRQKNDRDSKAFIEANNITKDQVCFRDGDGKPWFGHIGKFIEWMKENQITTRWAEWNGIIYFTSDLMNGVMPEDMPGRKEHLP